MLFEFELLLEFELELLFEFELLLELEFELLFEFEFELLLLLLLEFELLLESLFEFELLLEDSQLSPALFSPFLQSSSAAKGEARNEVAMNATVTALVMFRIGGFLLCEKQPSVTASG